MSSKREFPQPGGTSKRLRNRARTPVRSVGVVPKGYCPHHGAGESVLYCVVQGEELH